MDLPERHVTLHTRVTETTLSTPHTASFARNVGRHLSWPPLKPVWNHLHEREHVSRRNTMLGPRQVGASVRSPCCSCPRSWTQRRLRWARCRWNHCGSLSPLWRRATLITSNCGMSENQNSAKAPAMSGFVSIAESHCPDTSTGQSWKHEKWVFWRLRQPLPLPALSWKRGLSPGALSGSHFQGLPWGRNW